MNPEYFQKEFMILFENRDYSHQLMSQLYKHISVHIAYLNSGIHEKHQCFTSSRIEAHQRNAKCSNNEVKENYKLQILNTCCYYVDENRELQILKFLSILCSKHYHPMKNYLREQIKSQGQDESNYNIKNFITVSNFNFVKLAIDYLKALLPYMYLPHLYDNFSECLNLIFHMVDGGNEENISITLKENLIGICNELLTVQYFLDPPEAEFRKKTSSKKDKLDPKITEQKARENYQEVIRVIKANFFVISKITNPHSWLESVNYILGNYLNPRDQVNNKIIDLNNNEEEEKDNNLLSKMLNKSNQIVIEFEPSQIPQCRSYFGLRPHANIAEIDKVRANFRISILKVNVLKILLELASWNDPYDMSTMLKMHHLSIKLRPNTLRVNFCYQNDFFVKYHNKIYTTNLFNKVNLSIDEIEESGFVIEIGYFMFALIYKIKQYYQFHRTNKEYYERLLKIMPDEYRYDVNSTEEGFIQSIFSAFIQIYYLCKGVFMGVTRN